MQVTMSEEEKLIYEAEKLEQVAADFRAMAEAKRNEMPRLTITNQQASSQSTTVMLGYGVVMVVMAVLAGVASAAAVVVFLR